MGAWADLTILDADVQHVPSVLYNRAGNNVKATDLNSSYLTEAKRRIEDRIDIGFATDAVYWKARYREAIGVNHPYGVFGSPGA